MITCGLGEPLHEVKSLPDAIDALNDAAGWANSLNGICFSLTESGELDPWLDAIVSKMMHVCGGVADEINRAVEVIEDCQSANYADDDPRLHVVKFETRTDDE